MRTLQVTQYQDISHRFHCRAVNSKNSIHSQYDFYIQFIHENIILKFYWQDFVCLLLTGVELIILYFVNLASLLSKQTPYVLLFNKTAGLANLEFLYSYLIRKSRNEFQKLQYKMEFVHEGIALGVDLLILGLCMKEYVSYKKSVKLLKVSWPLILLL